MADPTARTSGWWDSLFGEPTRYARQPQSRGALLGMGGYQDMPDPKSSIEDRRQDPTDYAAWMKDTPSSTEYSASMPVGNPRPAWSDPMLGVGPTLSEGASDPDTFDPYKPSFSRNWKPKYTGQAPYNPFRIPRPFGDETFGPGNMGPNLPRGGGNLDTSVGGGTVGYDSDLPYIGAHLPIAPGDPNWTPPPSVSGPHNRGGDPARPGYGSPVMPMDFGMTLNSLPWGGQ